MIAKEEIMEDEWLCKKMGKSVRITHAYLVRKSGIKIQSKFNCDSDLYCGVAVKANSGSWDYDYSKCICPLYKKQ
jgi:hypothetical protein